MDDQQTGTAAWSQATAGAGPAPETPHRPAPPQRAETGEHEAGERRVSTLELFFDIVFVFTITQLTVLLDQHLSFAQAGRVAVIFAVLFWMYGAYAYLTNQVPPDTVVRRLALVLGMAGFMVCALAIPGVFGSDGLAFGLGFLLVTLVHSALYALIHGRYVLSFALPNLLAAGAVTAAGTVHGLAADALWVAAFALHTVAPLLSSRVTGRYADGTGGAGGRVVVTEQVGALDPAHFVERHGLLLIVAFGESVIAIGAGFHGRRLDAAAFGGIVLALALATALWWTYFVRDEGAAEEALRERLGLARFRTTMLAYYYSFIPMLLGVAVLAAGVEGSIGRLSHGLPTAQAAALAGGVALFLAGNVAFRAVLRLGVLRYRAAAVVAAGATIALGTGVAAVAEYLGLVLILAAMLLAEERRAHRKR